MKKIAIICVLIIGITAMITAIPYLSSSTSSATLYGGKGAKSTTNDLAGEQCQNSTAPSPEIEADNYFMHNVPACVTVPGFGVVCREY